MSHPELVLLVAGLMALNALSIDVMLPALPAIGASLGVREENDRQLVIVVYVMAAGIAQLGHGPLADALGRRAALLGSLVMALIAAALCTVSYSFPLLLAARALQGASTAGCRVNALALVRDLARGGRMAQIMSTALTVFTIVPILAPSLGQLVLSVGPWRSVFLLLVAATLLLLVWVWYRLPETLAPEHRLRPSARGIARGFVEVVTHRSTAGYMIAQTFGFGIMFSYLTSAQQVFAEHFALGALFPLAFASVALTLTASQYANARLVMRFGMRRLSHSAAVAFTLMSTLHALYVQLAGGESLATFLALLMAALFAFGFCNANFSAIAMEPMGHLAGSAAAIIGFVTTTFGALLGGLVGQAYDGSVVPLVAGQASFGLLLVLAVWIAERGRMFQVDPIAVLEPTSPRGSDP